MALFILLVYESAHTDIRDSSLCLEVKTYF
jgi:hypothetical protein